MQKGQQILLQNVHSKYRKASGINLPTQIAPDVWILTTPLAALANTMTLICPKKAMETIIIQKPNTYTEATHDLQHHLIKLSTYHPDMKL